MSSLRICANSSFRPIKALGENSVIQTEFNGSDLMSSIVVDTLTAVEAKDGGILLLFTVTYGNCKARGISGFDKVFEGKDLAIADKSIFSIWLHGKSYGVYDFKAKARVDLEPSSFEIETAKWLRDNGKIGKVFTGKLTLDSDEPVEVENVFSEKGIWTELNDDHHLSAVIKEYSNGAESNTGKKEFKTLAQRAKEKQDLVVNVAWGIAYPGIDVPTDKTLAVAIDLLETLQDTKKLDIFDRLMP